MASPDAMKPEPPPDDDSEYWQSPLGPARSVIPFVFGCAFPVAIVAFLALFHSGKPAAGALQFALATFLGSLISIVALTGAGGTIFALFHPTYPLWRKLLLFVAWRVPILLTAAAWIWVGLKHEWFGTFSMAKVTVDGAPGAFVSFSDLLAGFTALPLGIAVYHRRWIHERYCNADPRTLGLLRIMIGSLLVADGLRHWNEARVYYSNSGVLTNHYLLFRPFSNYNFSLFNDFSTLPEVHVVFAIATTCYLLYAIGYKTRLFGVLSFILLTSQDNRLVLVENGGYVVLNCLLGWSLFMPLGRRFSVDALLRSFREHKEKGWDDLGRRFRPADKTELQTGSIYLLALVNIAIIYFFNVVNKSGQIWKQGLTVHYVLHIDRMVTPFGVLLRELHMPLWLTRFASWAVLAAEATICAWILSPYGRRYTRPFAMALMHALHGLFGTVFRLGPFSWSMICWSYLLPRPENWADLETWYRKKARPRRVILDRRSPLAFFVGRVLARLDGLDLLEIVPSAEAGESGSLGGGESGTGTGSTATATATESGTAAATATALLAVEAPDGQVFSGTRALGEIAQALPGGRYFKAILWIGTLGTLPLLWGLVERRRDSIARFFGLGLAAKGAPEVPGTSPLGDKLASARVTARETLIAYLATCAFLQMMNENKCFPAQLHPRMPPYMAATTGYPRMFQGWGMFAANPITDDGSMTVDAVTIDGRRLDPFTGKEPDLNLSDARGLGLGQIRQDYWNRLRLERNKVYRQALKDYLTHYHETTGRPQDELVSFDVYWLRDQCPRPGEYEPYRHEKIALITYRKNNYVPPPGLPPLPPEPKIGNAEAGSLGIHELMTETGMPGDLPPMEQRGSGDVGR